MSPDCRSHRPPSSRAFSLVEVAIALGIVAFGFTALMGMLPVGLSLFRSAVDTSVATRIVQKVSGDLQQADFDNIEAAADLILYFDEQGTVLPSVTGSIYWARVKIFSNAELPGGVGAGTEGLARVVIQVAHNPAAIMPLMGNDGTWKEQDGIRLLKRALLVARNSPSA